MFENHSQWLLVALIAPMFWAAVNILDAYFVSSLYKNAFEGAAIFGLFQILPSVIVLYFVNKNVLYYLTPSGDFFTYQYFDNPLILALLGGFLFTLAFLLYFKALFKQGDVALLQIFWNLAIAIVPLAMFFLFSERLPTAGYVGLFLTLSGATLMSLHKDMRAKLSSGYFKIMSMAVAILSICMVLEGRVYDKLSLPEYGSTGFWSGFLFFSIGSVAGGVLLVIIGKVNVWLLIKKHYKVFVLAEVLTLLGTVSSHKAISLAPSVSYVAAVETFVPVFVLIFSLCIAAAYKAIKLKEDVVEKMLKEQLHGINIKIVATVVMAVGIYLIS